MQEIQKPIFFLLRSEISDLKVAENLWWIKGTNFLGKTDMSFFKELLAWFERQERFCRKFCLKQPLQNLCVNFVSEKWLVRRWTASCAKTHHFVFTEKSFPLFFCLPVSKIHDCASRPTKSDFITVRTYMFTFETFWCK